MNRKEKVERIKTILIEVVKLYIQRGEAVPSQLLAERLGFKVSPATIRNVLNRLEKEGYLYQPHTSAGRIPTDKGYRFYVNYLKDIRLRHKDREMINSILKMNATFEEIVGGTAKILSNMTKNIAVVLIPDYTKMIMRRIEFIKLSSQKILVIFIANTGSIFKKIIEIKENVTQDELIRISNYLSENFEGKTLVEIKEHIIMLMSIEQFRYDELMKKAIYIAKESFTIDLVEPRIFVEGTSNILDSISKEDISKACHIIKALEEKTMILNLLNKTMEKDGLNIYIGSESEIQDFEDIALVSSTYRVSEKARGCIGVIGPRRMYYERIIPLVSYIGSNFNSLLQE